MVDMVNCFGHLMSNEHMHFITKTHKLIPFNEYEHLHFITKTYKLIPMCVFLQIYDIKMLFTTNSRLNRTRLALQIVGEV